MTRPRAWRTGCGCGCGTREECLAGRPVPADADWHCCGQLSVEELNVAVRLGIHCQTRCVAQRLRAGDILESDAAMPGDNLAGVSE